jgi:hypothetical protein
MSEECIVYICTVQQYVLLFVLFELEDKASTHLWKVGLPLTSQNGRTLQQTCISITTAVITLDFAFKWLVLF